MNAHLMVVPNPYSPPTNILGKLTNHAKQGERASMESRIQQHIKAVEDGRVARLQATPPADRITTAHRAISRGKGGPEQLQRLA